MKLRKCDRCGEVVEHGANYLPKGWGTIKVTLIPTNADVYPLKKSELVRSGEQEVCSKCFEPTILEAIEFVAANASSSIDLLNLSANKPGGV